MKVAVTFNKKVVDAADVINVFGPQTKERYNPQTVERVATSLEKGGHNVKVIEGNINVVDELQYFMPRVIGGERPGMVFNMAYGIQGYSRYTHIPAMLEMLGVPYVGSGPEAHAVALDKVMSKMAFQQHNLPTPKFWVFSSPNEKMDDVEYPVIVKPKMEAVSMGLTIVDNQHDLHEAVQVVIENFQQQALVETFIPGREFAVGLLGNGPELEVLPIVEIDLGNDPNAIQTQDDKMLKPPGKICPAQIPDDLSEEMQRLARGAFNALGLHDFARIDVRMDADGNLYILEINSMASLGLTGSYVHSAKVVGYTFETLVNRMLDVAAVRYFGQEYLQLTEPEDQQDLATKPLRVRVRSYLRSNLTTMADDLRHMVEINTHVYNTEGVNTLGNWLSRRLAKLDFHRQVFPQVEVGNILYFSNHEGEQNDILILGHLDTIYGYQDYVPFREERGRFYGPGVAESKGGLAIMLGALQSLRYTRRLKRIRCGILLITDDTLGGRFSKKLVQDFAGRSNFIIGLKYGEANGGIVTSCSGGAEYHVELTNLKSPKVTDAPDVVKTICQKVITWQKLSSEEAGIVVKPARLEAHTSYGLSPDYATGSLLVRFKEKERGERLDNQIRQIARRGLNAKFQIRVRKRFNRPPFQENDNIKKFFEHVQQIAKRLEVKVTPVHRTTSSDICYVPNDKPALEGLGPIGGSSNSPNEFIVRDSLIDRAAVLAMVIRLSTEGL